MCWLQIFAGMAEIDLAVANDHELDIKSTMMYRHDDYVDGIRLVNEGKVHLRPLISKTFAFKDYLKAYQYIDDNRETTMKVIINVQEKLKSPADHKHYVRKRYNKKTAVKKHMSKRKDGGWQQAGGIMESKNENVKVPLISKIAYGFGDVGCNFSWMFVSNFLMIFLHRRIRNQYGSSLCPDAVFEILGCDQ